MTPRESIVAAALGEVGSTDWQKYQTEAASCYPVGVRKSWCGIFCVWCLRKAGVVTWEWRDNVGFLYRTRWQTTTHPEPGDIGYVANPFQHHFLVERCEGNIVYCIDGNSGPSPGTVQKRMRNRDDERVTYYSINRFLLGDSDEHDTEPPPPPAPAPVRLLRYGMDGADVLAWQEMLDRYLYRGELVLAPQRRSGRFDGYTLAATLAFQLAQGLKPDGLVGPLTRGKAGM